MFAHLRRARLKAQPEPFLSLTIHPPYRIWIDFLRRNKEVRALFDLEREYERVRQEYAKKDAWGIPMSVRERYERKLSDLRQQLQTQQAQTQRDVEVQAGRPL